MVGPARSLQRNPVSPNLDHIVEACLACDGIRASAHDEELNRRAVIARARRKIRRSKAVDAGVSITRRPDLLGSLIRDSGSGRDGLAARPEESACQNNQTNHIPV